MTVKELKEKLNQFDDNCVVCIPSTDSNGLFTYTQVKNVASGINEFDMVIFLDDYDEDEE